MIPPGTTRGDGAAVLLIGPAAESSATGHLDTYEQDEENQRHNMLFVIFLGILASFLLLLGGVILCGAIRKMPSFTGPDIEARGLGFSRSPDNHSSSNGSAFPVIIELSPLPGEVVTILAPGVGGPAGRPARWNRKAGGQSSTAGSYEQVSDGRTIDM